MAPCVRIRSTTPRTHATSGLSARFPRSLSRVSGTPVASSTSRAIRARAEGSPASTSATALPVCSRVRPTRDCRPNSSTASNSSRRRTRVRTRAGMSRARSRCQNGANSFRSTRSGGIIRYRRNWSSPASATARSTRTSSETGRSPTACRSSARSVRVCERLSTNPARCAASCTLSVKTSAFFSRGSRASSPNIVDNVTDSSVAIALPRNRMPSFC